MKNSLKPIPDFAGTNVQTSLTVVKLMPPVLPDLKSALKISDKNQTEKTNPPFYDELHFANYE